MGKVKRPKTKPKRKTPVGVPNANDVSQDEELLSADITPSELSIHTAIEQLQAPNMEDKLCGLQALATLLESPDHEAQLQQQEGVRVAAPLLLDEGPAVRNAAAGTLRNLSALGLTTCEHLIEQDVMTPLIAFFFKYAETWIPKQTNAGKLDEDADTFLQSVHLLWNLCENSGTAIKYVNESHVLPVLTRCLDKETFGNEMVSTVLHCLFVIIEDNPEASNEFKSSCEEPIRKIFSSADESPSELLLRILAAGIIINSQSDMASLPAEVIHRVMATLVAVMSVDIRNSCNQVSSILPLADGSSNPTKHKQNVEAQTQMCSLKNLIDAQQTAMEILTNICSYEEQDEESIDMEDASDIDSDMEDNEMTNCTTNGGETAYSSDKLPVEVIEAITVHGLVEKVWTKTVLPAVNVMDIFDESEDGKHLLKRLCILQSRSLLCLNNLISNLPLELLGGFEGIYRMWIETGKLVFKPDNITNEDILESGTAVMRAALDRFKPDGANTNGTFANNNLFKELTLNDIQLMLEGITQCQCPEIRANLTRMIGSLALVLSLNPQTASSETLRALADFILERTSKEVECWVLAEVIDTLMDLFAEDETDLLASQINLIDKLNVISPSFKIKAKQQRKSLGEHSAVVSTAVSNLPRFIKYKRNRVSKIKC